MPLLQTLGNGSVRGYGFGSQANIVGDFVSLGTFLATDTSTRIVSFNSINQDYTHLQIRTFCSGVETGSTVMNGSIFYNDVNTGSVYSSHQMYGAGSTIGLDGQGISVNEPSNINFPTTTNTSYGSGFGTGLGVMDIYNYSSNSLFKPGHLLTANSSGPNGGHFIIMRSPSFNSTSPITKITIQLGSSSTFNTGSRISLYGIR